MEYGDLPPDERLRHAKAQAAIEERNRAESVQVKCIRYPVAVGLAWAMGSTPASASMQLEASLTVHVSVPTRRAPVRGGATLGVRWNPRVDGYANTFGLGSEITPVLGAMARVEGVHKKRALQVLMIGQAGVGYGLYEYPTLVGTTVDVGYAVGWGTAATGVYVGGQIYGGWSFHLQLGYGTVFEPGAKTFQDGRVWWGLDFGPGVTWSLAVLSGGVPSAFWRPNIDYLM